MDFLAVSLLCTLGTAAMAQGQGVCNDDQVTTVMDAQITSSSELNLKDPMYDHGAPRVRLNTPEMKDKNSVVHSGGWSAGSMDVNQWIQFELKEPSLIKGVTTQGRSGSSKEWVRKYRVLYSMDCKNWKPVGSATVTDAFFKGNSDENTPVTNTFDCPIIAKCVRINPLEWQRQISMRIGLNGCALKTNQGTTTAPTTMAPVTTPIVITTTTTAAPPSTKITAPYMQTKVFPAVTTKTSGGSGILKPGKPGTVGIPGKCVKNCKGMPNGDYQSCLGCDHYITCNWGSMVAHRPCYKGLKWNDRSKICDWITTTCP